LTASSRRPRRMTPSPARRARSPPRRASCRASRRSAANFRGRLVLVVGQNLYFSRAGTPTDFDYSQRDVLAAVATGATSTFGRISQPIYAIVPFSNDTMIVGCDHSMLLVKGDPAGGGVMLTISDSIGMLYKDGWCIDPAGNLYFLGTGGFFRIPAGTQTIENLSVGKMDAFFAQIPKSHNVQLAWDRDNKGCWIFATPYSLPRHDDHERHLLLRRADRGLLPDGLPVQPRAGKRVRVRRRHDDGPLPRPGRARRAVPQVRHVRPHRRRHHDQFVHRSRSRRSAPAATGRGRSPSLSSTSASYRRRPNFGCTFKVGVGKDAYNAVNSPTADHRRAGSPWARQTAPCRFRLTGGAFCLTLLSGNDRGRGSASRKSTPGSSRRGGSGD
jgi:hypothetical protein